MVLCIFQDDITWFRVSPVMTTSIPLHVGFMQFSSCCYLISGAVKTTSILFHIDCLRHCRRIFDNAHYAFTVNCLPQEWNTLQNYVDSSSWIRWGGLTARMINNNIPYSWIQEAFHHYLDEDNLNLLGWSQ
jgi:hypothetical protein